MNNNRPRRKQGKGKAQDNNQGEKVILREIRDTLISQDQRPIPAIKDVLWPRLGRSRKLSFIFTSDLTTLSATAGSPTVGGMEFRLNQLSSTVVAAMTELFDMYRILTVKVIFVPRNPSYVTTLGSDCFTVIDKDSATTPGSLSDLYGYDTLLMNQTGMYFERVLVPTIAGAAWAGAALPAMQVKGGWLDTSYPNVQHYGLKYWMSPASASAPLYDVKLQVHVQVKDQGK